MKKTLLALFILSSLLAVGLTDYQFQDNRALNVQTTSSKGDVAT
ncbi:hypothetical protein [Alkalicoccobacillus gibsonii]|nr:hypothetical protein [Alkalicoccobacillus gibsonii]